MHGIFNRSHGRGVKWSQPRTTFEASSLRHSLHPEEFHKTSSFFLMEGLVKAWRASEKYGRHVKRLEPAHSPWAPPPFQERGEIARRIIVRRREGGMELRISSMPSRYEDGVQNGHPYSTYNTWTIICPDRDDGETKSPSVGESHQKLIRPGTRNNQSPSSWTRLA